MKIISEDVGIMGTGSNFFRSGLVHSSGTVYIGTYGPQPARVWCCEPRTGRLEQIGAPGEYQIDCMVEAPNGIVYMGTAYSALVYRLDPATNEITSLGSPALDSTSWIFTMIRTRSGEVYGAQGVGLFRLDWRHDRLEAIGQVPGDHGTAGPNTSSPITRQLVEAPDGTLWGDTNRYLFRYDPGTAAIDPLVDMVRVDPACYALMLPQTRAPDGDCYFALFSRYSGREVRSPLYVYRAQQRAVEPLPVEGWRGQIQGHPDWWYADAPLLLIPTWDAESERGFISLVNPYEQRVVSRWDAQAPVTNLSRLPGEGLLFIGGPRGLLLQADPAREALNPIAENPVPVKCRCLAASANGRLGADTYDCGCAVSRSLSTGEMRDHGRVWLDDHRSNYGPAAFAGCDGRYLLANHSEGMPSLWVTDTVRNRHWRVGESAVQLVAMADGSVWGTTGPNPPAYAFRSDRCWAAAWQARQGTLFRYVPGAAEVSPVAGWKSVGSLAPAPGGEPTVLMVVGQTLVVVSATTAGRLAAFDLPAPALAACGRGGWGPAYVVLGDQTLWALTLERETGGYSFAPVAEGFGATERGVFVLPKSGRVVGVAEDGKTTVYDPSTDQIATIDGASPLPAGPAVEPLRDAWYYAHQQVRRFWLQEG